MPILRLLIALFVALALTGAVFAIWPQADLAVTGWAHARFGFLDDSEIARSARDILRLAPFWLLAGLVAWGALRGWKGAPGPSPRALVFLIASLVIGSGLIVNLGLKNHSHRPRPVHVVEFGGDQTFRPWYRFDGACKHNCSFASGEAASGFWMLAPALLAPPPWRAVAIAGALVFGVATSALRIAFGGHFLSDVLAGGLISAIVVVAGYGIYRRRRV